MKTLLTLMCVLVFFVKTDAQKHLDDLDPSVPVIFIALAEHAPKDSLDSEFQLISKSYWPFFLDNYTRIKKKERKLIFLLEAGVFDYNMIYEISPLVISEYFPPVALDDKVRYLDYRWYDSLVYQFDCMKISHRYFDFITRYHMTFDIQVDADENIYQLALEFASKPIDSIDYTEYERKVITEYCRCNMLLEIPLTVDAIRYYKSGYSPIIVAGARHGWKIFDYLDKKGYPVEFLNATSSLAADFSLFQSYIDDRYYEYFFSQVFGAYIKDFDLLPEGLQSNIRTYILGEWYGFKKLS